jgi:ribosomal protein L24
VARSNPIAGVPPPPALPHSARWLADRGPRPPQRYFDRQELLDASEGAGGGASKPGSQLVETRLWEGLRVEAVGSNYFLNGLRVAQVSVKAVTANGPKPTLDEVQKIAGRRAATAGGGGADDDEVGSDGEHRPSKLLSALPDIAKLVESLGASTASELLPLQAGDLVQMYRGDLKNVAGRVVEVRGATFILAPDKVTAEALGSADPLELSVREAMKVFALSDHVKVGVGEYAGETGTVLALVPPDEGEPEDAVSADVMLDSGGGRHTRVPVKHLTKTTEVVRSAATIDVSAPLLATAAFTRPSGSGARSWGGGGMGGVGEGGGGGYGCVGGMHPRPCRRGTTCTIWWSCRGWGTGTGSLG